MPLQTFHLLRLQPTTSPTTFLNHLRSSRNAPSITLASRPRFLVIRPQSLDVADLASKPWDLLLLLQPASTSSPSIPPELRDLIVDEYTLNIGVPSRVANGYLEKNARLWREAPNAPLTGSLDKPKTASSSQNLELSPALARFMHDLEKVYTGPVTQLNLLHFHPGGEAKESYYKYGKGFVEVAGKRGGDAKIVGNVLKEKGQEGWDEISLVHYASLMHFCDMLAGEDYQEINEKHRLKALKDTVLMCTTELDLLEAVAGTPKL